MFRCTRLIVTLVTAASVIAGCTRDADVLKRRYVKSGDAYFAKKQYQDALIEYRKAVLKDDRYGEAHYRMAETLAALEDLRGALTEYARAADLLPDNVDLQIKTGNLLLVARRYQDAKTRARRVLQKQPNNVPGLILLGNALAALQDLDNAVAVTEKAAALDPDRAGFRTNLGVLELAKGNRDLAEAAFKKAVETDPKSVSARLALANFYQSVGQIADAENTLKVYIQTDPRNARVNKTLAIMYLDVGRPMEAEPYLRTAAESEDSTEAWVSLADYYIGTGRSPLAIDILRSTAKRQGAFVPSMLRIALVTYASGKHDEGHKVVNDILAKDPKNATAWAFESKLLLGERKLDDALKAANQALSADPKSAQGHLMLGRIYLARRAVDDAQTAFHDAVNLDPTFVDAHLELARLHLSRREIDTSIQYAEQGVKYAPERLDAHLSLVRSLAARDETWPRAEAEMKRLLPAYPKSAPVNAMMGLLTMNEGIEKQARYYFTRALELDPTSVDALGGLTSLDMAARKFDDAAARIDAQLAKAPKDPGLLLLAAKFYGVRGDRARTEPLLTRLIAADPGGLDGYNLLGQMYVKAHELSEAKTQYLEIVQRDPRAVSAMTMLGLLYQAENDLPSAQKWYERALQIDTLAALPANNLAWIFATNGTNLDLGLQLARTAKIRAPEAPEVNDTTGWLYYKKDLPALAVSPLEAAITKVPNEPTYHFHLGMVYARLGNDANARASLQRALQLNPRFAGAEEARDVLRTLVY